MEDKPKRRKRRGSCSGRESFDNRAVRSIVCQEQTANTLNELGVGENFGGQVFYNPMEHVDDSWETFIEGFNFSLGSNLPWEEANTYNQFLN